MRVIVDTFRVVPLLVRCNVETKTKTLSLCGVSLMTTSALDIAVPQRQCEAVSSRPNMKRRTVPSLKGLFLKESFGYGRINVDEQGAINIPKKQLHRS